MSQACSTESRKTGSCGCSARQGLMIMAGFLIAGLAGVWLVAHLG